MQELIDRMVFHYAETGPVVLLESQSADHPASNVSYLAARPEASIMAYGRQVIINEQGKEKVIQKNPWQALSSIRQKWGDWLFGYFGYDLKNHIEKLHSNNADALGAPDLYFMRPAVLLKIDRHAETIETIKRGPAEEIIELNPATSKLGELKSSTTKASYLSNIECAKRDIFEGTYYEINLSHQLQAPFAGHPYELYKRMRSAGPVPFGAFISFDDYNIASMSPERFLRKEGTAVFSQPIKGTMKRHDDAKKDEQLKEKLYSSVKNRAENMMIVDLVRNDLSRIAKAGSVKVSDLFEIQTFGTVHQMVSTIQAQTVVTDPVQIIKACYPMGSMTGAPKIKAMEAIEEYENYKRGIYSGSIGYFTPENDFDFNVVIRTAIINKNQLYYPVGGAIVSDSDPEEEWDETWLKAEALLKAIKE